SDVFFFSSRRRHTRFSRDWSSDVCSSDLRAAAGWTGFAVAGGDGDCGRWAVMAATSDKVALIRGPYRYGPYEYLYVNAQRIFACVHACEGIPTEALEAGVVRELIKAATRYLAATTRESDDDPNCWFEKEFAKAWLREVLARVRGEA